MKLKKVLRCGFILGLGVVSAIPVFASCQISEKYKTNVIYTVKNSATSSTSSSTFSESEYEELFYKALKDYLNVDRSEIPTDATLNITVIDRKTINEQNEQMLALEKESYEQNMISEEAYNQTLKNVEFHKNDTYDEVRCTIPLPNKGQIYSSDNNYSITFNADTKEVLFANRPISTEGLEILGYDKTPKISVSDFKSKCADLIKTYKIGGIETPVYVSTTTSPSLLIYQDKNDTNKKVTFSFDSATGNIAYICVW